MSTLRSRSRMPPGGWAFRDPSINWSMPQPLAKSFGTAVQTIIDARRNHGGRGSTDLATVATELDAFTCARLKSDPAWCVADAASEAVAKKASPSASPGKAPSLARRVWRAAAGAVDDVRKTATGAAILAGWLGDGAHPVAPELAANRAGVCEACPRNVRGDWRTMIQGEIAAGVLAQLRVKGELALTVANESELGTCAVCLCHLPLKVHVPLAFIERHTSRQVWSELPEWCWMRVEAKL